MQNVIDQIDTLSQRVEEMKSQRDQQKGAIGQLEKDMMNEFGTIDEGEAEEQITEAESQLQLLETEILDEFTKLQHEYTW